MGYERQKWKEELRRRGEERKGEGKVWIRAEEMGNRSLGKKEEVRRTEKRDPERIKTEEDKGSKKGQEGDRQKKKS